jgi:HlyD family secretion protein
MNKLFKNLPLAFKALYHKWKSLRKIHKALIIIALIFILMIIRSSINQKKQAKINQEIITVMREDLKKEVIRSGQVELQGVVEVKPPISGVITELLVENGQEVKEGQILFKIKSNATQAETSRAWATYLSAKNTYETAQRETGVDEWNEFESAKQAMMAIEEEIKTFEANYPDKKTPDNKEYQQLKLDETVARRNLDAAITLPNQINSHVSAAKASYQAALSAYNASKDGTYASPITGKIENLGINEGENVIADVGDKEGTPLFLIVPEGKKTISMQIGPGDAMLMQVGQKAYVKTDYIKDKSFEAQVARIDKVGKSVEGKGLVYRAWLEVNDNDNQLLLGIPVEIYITTEEKQAVLVVPSQAVHENFVTLVKQNGKNEERSVEVGLKANGKSEIVSGLQEGEQILFDHRVKK